MNYRHNDEHEKKLDKMSNTFAIKRLKLWRWNKCLTGENLLDY